MLSIIWSLATICENKQQNTKSKPLYKTIGVCNFTKLLLEVAQNKPPSGC